MTRMMLATGTLFAAAFIFTVTTFQSGHGWLAAIGVVFVYGFATVFLRQSTVFERKQTGKK